MKKQPGQRHFPYQHPTFGTVKNPKTASSWQNTVYYWWWSYLKRSDAYLETCNNNGQGPCSAIYPDFGDVRGDDFKAWWSENSRGVYLFAEPRAEDMVRVLEKGELPETDDQTLTISIPLYFPKEFILRRASELIDAYHKGKRGKQHAKESQARYKVRTQPNIPALKRGLMVYDFRKANPEMTLWRVAEKVLELTKDQKQKLQVRDPNVQAEARRVLAATVNRYLKRVRETITATESGLFP